MTTELPENELPQEASLNVTGAPANNEPVAEGETHPTYKYWEDEENQKKLNEQLKNAGSTFAIQKDENGNLAFTSDSHGKISLDRSTGTYSGENMSFEDCDPKNDQNVAKMGDQVVAIAKAHLNGPNRDKPFDLDVELNGAEDLSEEEKQRISEYKDKVKEYVESKLSKEEKQNLTFAGEKMNDAPQAQQTAQLAATGQTPGVAPTPTPGAAAQSNTPGGAAGGTGGVPTSGITAPGASPTPAPGSAPATNEEMNATAYFDKNNRLMYIEHEGNVYFNKSNFGPPGGPTAELMNPKPDIDFNDKMSQGELKAQAFNYSTQEGSLQLLSKQAHEAGQESLANQTGAPTPTEPQPHVGAEPTEGKPEENLHDLLRHNNSEMAENIQKEQQTLGTGFNLALGTNPQTGKPFATMTNSQTGSQISMNHDGTMDGSPAPTNATPEKQAEHHAKTCLGMMATQLGRGKVPIGMDFSFPGIPPEVQNMVKTQLMSMLDQPGMKSLKDMVEKIDFNGENIHHNKDAPKNAEALKQEKEAAKEKHEEKHEEKTWKSAKPTPGHSAKHEDEHKKDESKKESPKAGSHRNQQQLRPK